MKKFNYLYICVILFIGFLSNNVFAQEVPFNPRTSQEAPSPYKGVQNYNLQGDFVMIGNANLGFTHTNRRNDNSSNNQSYPMSYIDIDGDNNTINSSSSELKLGDFDPTCSEIIYAGLYWTGKGDNTGSKTINIGGTPYRKDRVKFKKEGETYEWVNAGNNLNEIRYPSSQSNIYVGYADVTEYVKEHGVGNYYVADMALVQGSNSNPGYFGGWGMVVIYKNPAMKWRDITVFDGYAYISSGRQEFDISGFRAAQNGAINIKMGIMAGEGDKGTSGDYIEIRQRTSNSYTRLSHDDNSTNNFFNASIFTGGNNRNPSNSNNAGVDIAMFNLPNTNNAIINNNQNSTRFRYGTSGDYYSIFSIVFAVDAYVPEVVGENTPANTGTVHGSTVIPGQDLEFDLKIYNKGEEAVNNMKVEIPIPFNLHYAPTATVQVGTGAVTIPGNTTVNWVAPAGAPPGATPQNTPGGTLVWNIGTLPYDATKSILQGTLKYKLKVTENCALLTTAGPCGLQVKINGKITGTGATSNTAVSSDLVRDYGSGACAGPIYDDFESTINISDDFKTNCSPPPVENGMLQFVAFCSLSGNVFPRAHIVDLYPSGTKFFTSQPTGYSQTTNVLTGDFPVNTNGTKTIYWAVVPGMDPGCFIRLQTSLTLVTTTPTAQNVTFCKGDIVTLNVTRSVTGVDNNYELFYYDTLSATTPMTTPPNPATVGTHTYWVAEGVNQNGIICTGNKIQFTITIYEQPTVAQNVADVSICENSDTQFTVTTSGATSYAWEYTTAAAPTVWLTLDNSSFSGQITLTNNTMSVSHAMRVGTNSIDGIKVRLKAINDNGCEAYSNEIAIEVKDCRAITNPMLPSKANK